MARERSRPFRQLPFESRRRASQLTWPLLPMRRAWQVRSGSALNILIGV
jgi:hypothetical protein